MSITKIPIEQVSTRRYIAWQCGATSGMSLNRLAEVCGCFSDKEQSYGCHHPKRDGDCIAGDCPIANIDWPEGLTEEQEDKYAQGWGDEVYMALATRRNDPDKGNNFGKGGKIKPLWYREERRADDYLAEGIS
jgi:hypothetical protein